jgi:integrase
MPFNGTFNLTPASIIIRGSRKKCSLYVVQSLLGHSQIRMTQRDAHLAPQTLLDAAEVAALVIQPNGAASAGLPEA